MASFETYPHTGLSTRNLIVDAARKEIAERGYDGMSLRGVARRAGVDPGLVRHYFGSKDGLLVHAVRLDLDPRELVAEVVRGRPNAVGRRLAALMFEFWDNPRTASMSLARLSAALNNAEIADAVREDFLNAFFGAVAEKVSPDRPELRASLVSSQMLGVALMRYLADVPTVARYPHADLVRQVARTVQHYLMDPLPAAMG